MQEFSSFDISYKLDFLGIFVMPMKVFRVPCKICQLREKSAVSRKRREFGRFPTFQERQKTAFGLFLANSGISCKVKAFAFDAAVTRNDIKSNLA